MNNHFLGNALTNLSQKRGLMFGLILLSALVAFEIFNFSTTQYALADVLGDLNFAGIRWATILAIAFCGIDFAGLARMFTPEQGRDEPAEVWYLFGAWLLAGAMNASLTWWGVAVAVNEQSTVNSAVLSPSAMTTAVPIFVALMVWVIRILIIGTFAVAGERIFTMAEDGQRPASRPFTRPAQQQPAAAHYPQQRTPVAPARPVYAQSDNSNTPYYRPNRPASKPEPTYHSVGLSATQANEENAYVRR